MKAPALLASALLLAAVTSPAASQQTGVEFGAFVQASYSRRASVSSRAPGVNELLSRAPEAVKAFLIENGVAAERMAVQGYASTQPVATNKTASGRAQNRRVELRRTD